MKKLVKEFGVTKVDAENCIDCLLGGKKSIDKADPNKELIFLTQGMISFWKQVKKEAEQEGIDEQTINQMYNGIKGIVYLDTIGDPEKNLQDIKQLKSNLPILEVKKIGLSKLKALILESITKTEQN